MADLIDELEDTSTPVENQTVEQVVDNEVAAETLEQPEPDELENARPDLSLEHRMEGLSL
ncbi:MAG: hypothetical protein AAFY99_07610 [Pseudomonadota bacterium]